MKTKNKHTLNEVLDILKEKELDRNEYQLLYDGFETQINKDGYLQFRLTEKDTWKNVHTLVNRYFNSEEHDKKFAELVETKIERCLVTHHIEFFEKDNKLNNHPDNLQWLGKQEHILFHSKLKNDIHLKRFWDKIWNPDNPEYEKNYNIREKEKNRLSLMGAKNIIKINKELWHGENNEEHRKMMSFIQSENTKKTLNKLWHGENNEEYRKNRVLISKKSISIHNEEYWNGEGNEDRRQKQGLFLKERHSIIHDNLWYGENNEEFRKKMTESGRKVMNIINRDPNVKSKILEGRVFQIFNKIINAGEKITDESFLKYKSKFSTYPETVFGSIEIAIEKYQNYPKKIIMN